MRANLIALVILLAVACAAFLRAAPAECETCYLTGTPCYGNYVCGQNCICIQPNGPGSEGWCN